MIKNPITIDRWDGLFTLKGSHLIGDNFLSNAKNISVSDGSISPFKMYSLFANRLATGADKQTVNTFTTVRADGTEIPLKVRDDGSNTHIEWYNNVGKRWDILLPNLTTGTIPTFADFNTSTQDEVWWCNGTENMTLWTKVFGSVSSNTATTITLNETPSTAGFSAGGGTVILEDGNEYAYTGINDGNKQLTGLAGLPTLTANYGVAEAADDSTYAALTKYDILLSADGRMWGASSAGVALAYSEVGDATNWTAGTNPGDPGLIDMVEGEGPITNLQAIKENIIVFKRDLVSLYRLDYPSSTTRVESLSELRRGNSNGCVGKLASCKVGQSVSYTTPKGGVKSIYLSGDNELNFDDNTDNIRPTLKNGVFTSTAMTYFEKERVILASYKKDGDSSRNDRVVVIQMVKGDNDKMYQALGILDWTVNSWFIYDSDLYFGDSYQPNCFKAFDGYSKDGGPFTALGTTKRYSFEKTAIKQKEILYFPVSGWISAGTTLKFEIDYDYAGTRGHLTSELSGVNPSGKKYVSESEFNTIGAFELGTEPIGGTVDEIDELNYFRVFFSLPKGIKPYDIQVTVYSDTEGARWKLETLTFDVADAQLKTDDSLIKIFT